MNQIILDITSDLEKVFRKIDQLKGKKRSVDESIQLVIFEEIEAELRGRLSRVNREENCE